MVLLDEKPRLTPMQPPPPYVTSLHPPPFSRSPRQKLNLATLPSHLLLRIVYSTFTANEYAESMHFSIDEERVEEKTRRALYWLSISLRLVNRSLFIACMHILRSTYLPSYQSLIRSPYTSDPFPLSATPPTIIEHGTESIEHTHRETAILDQFIALKVRSDVWSDDSDLHLSPHESFRDLFDLAQPKARLEDLVRKYGVRENVVSFPGSDSGCATPITESPRNRKGQILNEPKPLPFRALSVSFSTRKIGLVYQKGGTKRTIVEVPRTREEKLEYAAKRLVKELGIWMRRR